MKYLQFFNESIVEDKILYLKDLCDEFFDEHDDFEFKIVNGKKVHSWQSIIPDYMVGNDRIKLLYHNDPEKYIFVFIRNVDGLTLGDPDYLILNQFENYLEKVGFLPRGYTGYYRGRLYRFDKHSKMTQNYF